jgi:hypothetical protein
MRNAPGHKRRKKSKSRIDVTRTNNNRIRVKDGKLTITIDAAYKSTIRDKAIGYDDFSELLDSVVLLEVGRQTLSIKCRSKHLKDLRHLAKRHQVKLIDKSTVTRHGQRGETAFEAYGDRTLDAKGKPEDCMDYSNHIAGHSDLEEVSVELVTSTMESTQTDAHVADAMKHGLTDLPKRIDYTAGRNQPKATYSLSGYSANDVDHVDTRNNNKRAGMFAPDIPHTELRD